VTELKTCPSGRCISGALLLGVVQAGTVSFVTPPLEVDDEFVNKVEATARRRFRFAEPCVKERCTQWTGQRCGVIDEALDSRPVTAVAPLPSCAIRQTCRWFHQSGRAACATCRLVITEIDEAVVLS
jgi:hypothetical protein